MLVILVMFLFIFIAVAALAVDLAATGARGQDLQNTSDAAALAGVVELQEQMLAGASLAEAEAAARDVIAEIMRQNGIDPSGGAIVVDVEVAADGSRLQVSITDNDPDQHLPSDILGRAIRLDDPSIQRSATAEFLACDNECSLIVEIKAPFGAVSARGNGDGYKPIQVGDNLYALNHNSGERNIVCINTITEQPCWSDGVFRTAYSSSVGFSDRNPEMPHTAVVGTRIYWSVTDRNSGLRLFCWETASGLDYPCPSAVTLDASLRRYNDGDADNALTDDKDENRGGGTFALGDKVFAFSDNHRIHCFDPLIGGTCAGYGSRGNATALDVFPANSPVDGNHGSSIDRIVDENTGYVYSTLHIPFAQDIDCSSALADPVGHRVVVLNELTGRYLASDSPDSVLAAADGADEAKWWDVRDHGSDTVSLQSARHGEYLDAQPFAGTSVALGEDDRWDLQITGAGDAYYINSESSAVTAGSVLDDDGDIVEEVDPPTSPQAEWSFYPWQCGIDPTITSSAPAYFTSGTWLHCYDTGVVSGTSRPCPGFQVRGTGDDPSEPSPIHPDGTRFSGRLWFYYEPASEGVEATKLGVCSSGYGQWYDPGATYKDPSTIEINCVDLATGTYNSAMSSAMSPVRDTIRSWTGTDPGAWGDPHWNPEQNRLLYPTEHNRSRIICYDFDDRAPCGDLTGQVPPSATGVTSTEDYGFVSDGNCIYALGHTAYFWAFKASDINEPCEARIPPSRVERCGCGDGATYRWGELDFREIDLNQFTVFGVRIMTDDGGDGSNSIPIFPFDGRFLSLKPGGADPRIPLDDLAIPDGAQSILVEFEVDGLDQDAIENVGDFEIRFAQRPRLVD